MPIAGCSACLVAAAAAAVGPLALVVNTQDAAHHDFETVTGLAIGGGVLRLFQAALDGYRITLAQLGQPVSVVSKRQYVDERCQGIPFLVAARRDSNR